MTEGKDGTKEMCREREKWGEEIELSNNKDEVYIHME